MIKKKEKTLAMKKIGSYFLITLSFMLTPLLISKAWAAPQSSVKAQVDRQQVGIGDPIRLTVSIQSNEDFNDIEPSLPAVAGLDLIQTHAGGKSTSSRMSIVNGRTDFSKTISQSYIYILSAQREGEFIIPIIDIGLNGQIYKTQPIKIFVKDEYRQGGGSNHQEDQPGRRRFPPGFGQPDGESEGEVADPFSDEEDIFGQLLKEKEKMFDQLRRQMGQNPGALPNFPPSHPGAQVQPAPSRQLNINTKEAFFIYLDLDKAEVYEGEQVTANWYIYSRGQITSLDRAKFPDLKGFWKEIIEEVPSLQFSTEIVNGIPYQKALLASHALFPIKAGTSVIDEFKIKAKVMLPTSFGWGRPNEFTKASKRISLKVLPLPIEGRPKSFSGAVGSFQIHTKTEGMTFPAHQPLSLRIRFEGQGNAKLIELPAIDWPPELEIFDTKSESKFYKNGESYKEFEVLLIPRKEGQLTIPGITFSYFDPKTKRYIETSSEPLGLTITEGTVASAQISGNFAGVSGSSSLIQIQPILDFPTASFSISAQQRGLIYIGILVLGLVGILGQFLLKYKNVAGVPDLSYRVQQRIGKIESLLKQEDDRKLGAEATNLIYILAVGLAGEKGANREWGELVQLIPTVAKEKFLERLTQLFDYFQMVGFAPESMVEQLKKNRDVKNEVQHLKQLSNEIIKDIR